MSIFYNVTGDRRKALVTAISEILGQEPVYTGAPNFDYTIGNYAVDKKGTLICRAGENCEETDRLIAALKERGYEEDGPENTAAEGFNGLVIEVPREGFTDEVLENLRKIITSKETIIKKMLGLDGLTVEILEDKLRFPWFTLTGANDEVDAYTRFVHALCNMAKQQKRVTAKEQNVENDKFVMRLFLIRLGFIGPEYKSARKILLQNLTGNSSWKSGQSPKKVAAEQNNAEETSISEPKNMEEVAH